MWRGLVNIRPALQPIPDDILQKWNQLLANLLHERGIVNPLDIVNENTCKINGTEIMIWQGDITRLDVDGIVNAANSQFEGCFVAGHHCIDNAIHTFAGPKLRDVCALHIKEQGTYEHIGRCTITPAFSLPAKYILHTVGPNVANRKIEPLDYQALQSCYEQILATATVNNLSSIAICSVSTGVFGFDINLAAPFAKQVIISWLQRHETSLKNIVLNTFSDSDSKVYHQVWEI